MKKIRLLSLLSLVWVSTLAHALYYYNDVTVDLINHASEPYVLDLHWFHGSNWFSTNDSQPLDWSHVVVPANGKVSSTFAVMIFPKNQHSWDVSISDQSGTRIALFSDKHNDLLELGDQNHHVSVEIADGGCSVTVRHGSHEEHMNAQNSDRCQSGQLVVATENEQTSE